MCIIVYLQEYNGCTDVNVSFKLIRNVRNTSRGGEGVSRSPPKTKDSGTYVHCNAN